MTDQTFLDTVCAKRRRLKILLSVCVALFVVLLAPFAAVEPGTSTYLITVFQLVTLAPIIVGLAALLAVCRSRVSEDLPETEAD